MSRGPRRVAHSWPRWSTGIFATGAKLEYRAQFVASGDDRIDIIEIEGGVAMSIRLRGRRFGVRRDQHDDDGEVAAVEECGWFDSPASAAACVIVVLRREARTNR
jgi:hypothetical protein